MSAECTCPHTATREGFIKNGTNSKCPIHGQAQPAPIGEPEILDDKILQEMLTSVRTINRLHVQDQRWDQTIVRGRSGKSIYDHMQIVLEEVRATRAKAKKPETP